MNLRLRQINHFDNIYLNLNLFVASTIQWGDRRFLSQRRSSFQPFLFMFYSKFFLCQIDREIENLKRYIMDIFYTKLGKISVVKTNQKELIRHISWTRRTFFPSFL